MSAVSIELAGGSVITLMPFETVAVKSGQEVLEGSVLGTLASSGDASSLGAHVHMGYRRDREYLDPMLLFGVAVSAASDGQPEAIVAPSPMASLLDGTATAPGVEGSPYAAAIDSSAAEISPSHELQRQAQPGLNSAVNESLSFGTIETGFYLQRQRPQRESALLSTISDVRDALGTACSMQLDSLLEAFSSAAETLHIPTSLLIAGASTLAVGAAALFFVAGFKLVIPRFQQLLKAKNRRVTCQPH